MNPYELKSTFDMKVALLFKTKGSYLWLWLSSSF
jgi:hypothetical protein